MISLLKEEKINNHGCCIMKENPENITENSRGWHSLPSSANNPHFDVDVDLCALIVDGQKRYKHLLMSNDIIRVDLTR